MGWLELTLISALGIAAADTVLKKYLTGLSVWDLLLVRFSVPGLLLLPYALSFPPPSLQWQFSLLMLLLIVLEIAAMLFYVRAITSSPLHLTLPYLSFTPVFNIVTGYVFLGEKISAYGALGILLIFAGSYILNLPQQFKLNRLYEPILAIWQYRGSRLMLACAFIYSTTSTLSKKAMGYSTPESFGAYYYVIIGFAVILLYPLARNKNYRQLSQHGFASLTVAVLMAVMVVTHFLAIAKIEAAYMVSVKRSSMLFGILFGALFFGEKNLGRNLLAASIMLAGIYVLLTLK